VLRRDGSGRFSRVTPRFTPDRLFTREEPASSEEIVRSAGHASEGVKVEIRSSSEKWPMDFSRPGNFEELGQRGVLTVAVKESCCRILRTRIS